jgi:hypothetical protein
MPALSALQWHSRSRQQIAAGFGGLDRELAIDPTTLHQPLIDGVLPDGQSRATRLPRLHNITVASRASRDPFHEIEHEGIRSMIHGLTVAILGRHIQYME